MLSSRFSVPAGNTVIGTFGCSLIRAETVPSPPTATRQRHPRGRFRLGNERLPFGGSPGDLGIEAQFRKLASQASNQEVVATSPGTPVGDDPHPRFTGGDRRIDWTSVDMPVQLRSQLILRKCRRQVARLRCFILLPDPCSFGTEFLEVV